MSLVSHLLTDTVTYSDLATIDANGAATWGAQASVLARVEFGTFRIQLPDGEERDAQARIMSDADIPDTARVWLPGDDTTKVTKSRVIMRRKKATTPSSGLTLYEIYL